MKKILTIFIFLAIGTILFAQSAEKIDAILESEILTKGEACYLVGTAIGTVQETDSYETAFKSFKGLKIFKNSKHDDPIRFDEFSNLALQNSSLKHGLWYRVTKSNHYAFRQLKMMKLIPQTSIPSAKLKPFEAVNLLAKIMPDK